MGSADGLFGEDVFDVVLEFTLVRGESIPKLVVGWTVFLFEFGARAFDDDVDFGAVRDLRVNEFADGGIFFEGILKAVAVDEAVEVAVGIVAFVDADFAVDDGEIAEGEWACVDRVVELNGFEEVADFDDDFVTTEFTELRDEPAEVVEHYLMPEVTIAESGGATEEKPV